MSLTLLPDYADGKQATILMEASVIKTHHTAGKAARMTVVVTAIAAIFFSVTNPSQGNAVLIMLGSVMMSAVVYTWLALLVSVIASQKFIETQGASKPALLLAAPVIYVVLMQSIGQLNAQDILAVVPLVVILYLYLVRVTVSRV